MLWPRSAMKRGQTILFAWWMSVLDGTNHRTSYCLVVLYIKVNLCFINDLRILHLCYLWGFSFTSMCKWFKYLNIKRWLSLIIFFIIDVYIFCNVCELRLSCEFAKLDSVNSTYKRLPILHVKDQLSYIILKVPF